MSGLTQTEINELRGLLGGTWNETGADRGGFYLAFYTMLDARGLDEAAAQLMLQAHISTYSGFIGGAALLANAIAKHSNPDDYVITLQQFSWEIADYLLTQIEIAGADHPDTLPSANDIQVFDQTVWADKGLSEYFPGNIQLWDQGIDNLFTAGTLSSLIAGYQLLFGSRVGNQASDFVGPNYQIDDSNTDYLVIWDVSDPNPDNKVAVYVEEKLGILGDIEAAFIEDPALAIPALVSATLLALEVPILATAVSGLLLVVGGLSVGIISGNDALKDAVAKVVTDLFYSIFTDSELDFGLRAALVSYTGAQASNLDPNASYPLDPVWDDFPLIMRSEGVFSDSEIGHILVGHSDAVIDGGGGEDFGLAFGTSTINGDADNDYLIGKDSSTLRGGIGDDVVLGFGSSAKAYGDSGNDWIVAANGAEAFGGIGDDFIVGFGASKISGDAGNDILIQTGSGAVTAGDGDDLYIGVGAAAVDLGAGNDVVLYAAPGSLITTGSGEDSIYFAPGAGVTDADGYDRLGLYGGLFAPEFVKRNSESESPFAWGASKLVKVGFNTVGEMVVGDIYSQQGVDSDFMYLMNAVNDPYAAPEDLTAGIRVAEITVDVYRLKEIPPGAATVGESAQQIYALLAAVVKDIKSSARVAGSDPLVFDLDGDGIELSTILSPGIGREFDLDGDGFAEPTGWVGPDDGMLAVDINANGTIDDVSELFGDPDTSGFAALAAYDTNTDGVVDALDANFNDLRIWQDLNGNAVTDAGELSTLAAHGIQSISLTYQVDGTKSALNTIARVGSFTFSDLTTGTVADVEFRINNFNTTYLGDTTVDPLLTAGMPNVKGYGTLTDLHVALTIDGENGPLSQAIDVALPTLNVVYLETLRENALPILQA